MVEREQISCEKLLSWFSLVYCLFICILLLLEGGGVFFSLPIISQLIIMISKWADTNVILHLIKLHCTLFYHRILWKFCHKYVVNYYNFIVECLKQCDTFTWGTTDGTSFCDIAHILFLWNLHSKGICILMKFCCTEINAQLKLWYNSSLDMYYAPKFKRFI